MVLRINNLGIFTNAILIIIICIILNHYLMVTGQINSEKKGIVNTIYFTTTTLSSVGYGDLLPITPLAKSVVSIQHLLVFLGSWGILNII